MHLSADRLLVAPAADQGPGWVRIEDGRIVDLGAGRPPAAARALPGLALAPGLVDMHAHGGGGASFTTGDVDAARHVLATHRRHGTTSMMASLVTDTEEALLTSLAAYTPLVAAGELLGVHLEGPWMSPCHRGAHDPALLVAPDPAQVARVVDAHPGTVAMVTLAPELPGGLDAVRLLTSRGILAALGHSDASYEQSRAAITAGVRVATHLFNAMRAFHHREPGPVLALSEDPRVALELIADGTHVAVPIIAAAFRALPERIVLITDAMAAAACADGDYRLGPLDVQVRDGVARVADTGAIAGSTITLADAVRLCVQRAGVPLEAAVRAATAHPARTLGRTDIGTIAVGARADLIAIDPDGEVHGVLHGGRWVVDPDEATRRA